MMTIMGEIDFSLQFEKCTEPIVDSPHYDHKMLYYSIDKVKWERSNKKYLIIIKSLIKDQVKG
jgi:hypothetical protein